MEITKATPLTQIKKLAPACKCKQCSHGCTMGSGVLADGDVQKIAQQLNISSQELKDKYLEQITLFNQKKWRPKLLSAGKPFGKCIFFEQEKGCAVHPNKPLQCQVAMGCKDYGQDLAVWFMLNHVIDVHDPQSVREYHEYIKSGGKVIPGGTLEELVPDKEKRQYMLDYGELKHDEN